MSFTEHFFPTKAELHEALASAISGSLTSTDSHLFVSGGSTPKPMFKILSTKSIDWSTVTAHLVDERLVPEDHKDSNAALVKDNLIQNAASAANFSPLYLGEDEAANLSDGLNKLDKIPFFDCVVLGMGGDSHTASLFPNQTATDQAFHDGAPVLAITEPSDAPHRRLGLTLTGFKKAKTLILHIEGDGKREVYEQAKKSDLPIGRVLNHPDLNTQVYWSP